MIRFDAYDTGGFHGDVPAQQPPQPGASKRLNGPYCTWVLRFLCMTTVQVRNGFSLSISSHPSSNRQKIRPQYGGGLLKSVEKKKLGLMS
jgi:hypothetical protein